MSRIRILSGTQLKLIAIISMVIDHVGSVFFPEAIWMRAAGRLAMPIFAFCIAEGYRYTHSKKQYLLRLGLFALVSELPFDLAFFGGLEFTHQNIMLTFFLAVLCLMIYDAIRLRFPGKGGILPGILTVLAAAVLAAVLGADYTLFGVISVFLFYVPRRASVFTRQLISMGFLALSRTIGYYAATGLSLIPLLMYSGKRGKGLKWLFYAFYPGHLLLIWGIAKILGM